MLRCDNCGQEVKAGAKFCTNCGVAINSQKNHWNEGSFYDGQIHKCPRCGEVINSFVVNCPSCGYELRGTSSAHSVQTLYLELNRISSVEQKAILIRNFPIPNAKEDIIEFLILASTNIGGEIDTNIFEAWVAKFEQAYRKAQITLQEDKAFAEIKEIYEKTEKTIRLERLSHATSSVDDTITSFFKVMPNPVFAILAMLLIIFNLIRLFRGEFAGMDIIFDVIVLSITYKLTEKGKPSKHHNDSTINGESYEDHRVKVPSDIIIGTSENYAVVENMLKQAGFTNTKTIPLNDLTFWHKGKNGSTDKVTIGGKEPSYFRRKLEPDVPIIITYHSLRK